MTDCIFCKIVEGQIPSNKVWEDGKHLAFLDIHPIKEGHTMVIPKKHYPYLFDLTDTQLAELWLAAKQVSKLLKQVFNPKSGKIGVLVYGLDVDHTHIHLVPIDKSGDLSFANAKPATEEQLKKTQKKIAG